MVVLKIYFFVAFPFTDDSYESSLIFFSSFSWLWFKSTLTTMLLLLLDLIFVGHFKFVTCISMICLNFSMYYNVVLILKTMHFSPLLVSVNLISYPSIFHQEHFMSPSGQDKCIVNKKYKKD